MKNTFYGIAGAVVLTACSFSVQAHDGMKHDGGYADHMFKEMDTNKDGAVSQKEFTAAHEKRFKEMDANKDGKVTLEEMDAYAGKMREQMRGEMREHFKQRFDAADANHDGGLSKDEAQQMPMIAQRFDEIDANHDGKVTQEEIQAFMATLHGKGGEGQACSMDGAKSGACGMHQHGMQGDMPQQGMQGDMHK